jgi:hypothetical protein
MEEELEKLRQRSVISGDPNTLGNNKTSQEIVRLVIQRVCIQTRY